MGPILIFSVVLHEQSSPRELRYYAGRQAMSKTLPGDKNLLVTGEAQCHAHAGVNAASLTTPPPRLKKITHCCTKFFYSEPMFSQSVDGKGALP